jgi:hypothetical protein
MRTQAVRLLSPYAMYAGAHVDPESERPTTRRLYELTVGAHTAASARACASSPPAKQIAHLRQAEAALVLLVLEQVLRLAIAHRDVEVRASAGAVGKGLRHERRDHRVLARELARRHLDEREVVGALHRVRVREVHLELAVAVLVVDLVDVHA